LTIQTVEEANYEFVSYHSQQKQNKKKEGTLYLEKGGSLTIKGKRVKGREEGELPSFNKGSRRRKKRPLVNRKEHEGHPPDGEKKKIDIKHTGKEGETARIERKGKTNVEKNRPPDPGRICAASEEKSTVEKNTEAERGKKKKPRPRKTSVQSEGPIRLKGTTIEGPYCKKGE